MDIEQVRTFLAITAHGNFLEATRQLHLTQSTLSARIQRLEEELGSRLFGATVQAPASHPRDGVSWNMQSGWCLQRSRPGTMSVCRAATARPSGSAGESRSGMDSCRSGLADYAVS